MKQIILSIYLLAFCSCATMQTHSFDNTMQKLEVNIEANKAFSIAVRTAMDMNWEIINTDSQIMTFSAKTPKTMSRWDDDVNLYVDKSESGSIINVKSKLGHESNRKYIETYLQTIKNKINQ